jgi:formylglycine-generating enzyme required for sulfatase activity
MRQHSHTDRLTCIQPLPTGTISTTAWRCAPLHLRAGVVREPRYELISWTFQLQTLDAPVNCLAWEDAMAYAAWLADRTGQAWRLPTEAEWEKAARGVDGRLYPGEISGMTRAKVDMDDDPTPVGAYASYGDASPCGAHDLAGNVWEWTSSLYRPYPYAASDGREDPAAAGTRVLRGGCCCNDVSEARTASRNGNAPAEPDFAMGMRLALTEDLGTH